MTKRYPKYGTYEAEDLSEYWITLTSVLKCNHIIKGKGHSGIRKYALTDAKRDLDQKAKDHSCWD